MQVSEMLVKKRNGRLEPLNLDKINKCADRACKGLDFVSASEIVLDAHVQLFNKVSTSDIDKALIMSAKSKIEKEPNYSYAASRLLANTIYKEVFGEGVDAEGFELQYKKSFIVNIKKMVKAERLHPKLLAYDLKRLADALIIENDRKFKYLGLQTLYDRYFIHIDGIKMEAPQSFWMRIAMGLAINEKNKEEKAIEFYNIISNFFYCPSTPTLFNSGTMHPQLSSCYLSTLEDSIDGIFGTIHSQARLSKYAGGLGIDVTPLRGTSSYIKGTNGKSQGLIPWLKIINDMLVSVNQGGKRPGSGCVYLENWHIDVDDFLEIRKNTGDERRRCHDMNTALWISDLFMKQVKADSDWYLFTPSDVPDLHDLYGNEFEKRYRHYVEKANNGEIKNYKKMSAKSLWKKMLTMLIETGHPWITFKDPSNIRYSNKHVGSVHSSNLCTEILLHTIATEYKDGQVTKSGETAVCNLGSLNLIQILLSAAKEVENSKKDVLTTFYKKIQDITKIAIRMLDNVIDENFYPTEEAKNANKNNRPVGLGIMGFHDVLHYFGLSYEDQKAKQLSSDIHENISYQAILSSSELAKEYGTYPNYKGSLWDQNIFPIDSYNSFIAEYRPNASPAIPTLNWSEVRDHVSQYGMRNSNTMAIAPTATISYIQGCSQSIEPDYSVIHVYSTLSGEFTMINEAFVKRAKEEDLWCNDLIVALKSVDGDVSALNLPDSFKQEFKTCFNISQQKLIDCAAARQVWIDMGQSLNMYSNLTSLKYLNDIYMHAWETGLKTTYYLRSQSASRIEKATAPSKESSPSEEAKACSIEAARNGTICESCQ